MRLEDERKTQITIVCKDGTKRVIYPIGARDIGFANDLCRDLEGSNFKYAIVNIL